MYEIILAIIACCGASLVVATTIFLMVGIILGAWSIIEYAIKSRKEEK